MAIIEKRGRFGFIDRSGNWAIEPKFSQARSFEGELAKAQDPDGRWGLIDQSGKWRLKPGYLSVGDFNQEGVAIVTTDPGLKAGIINRQCAFVVRPQFRYCDEARPDGLIRCQYGHDPKDVWYITAQGEARVPLGYDPSLESPRLNATPIDQKKWWPDPKPKPEPKPEAKPEARPEAKPEAKPKT